MTDELSPKSKKGDEAATSDGAMLAVHTQDEIVDMLAVVGGLPSDLFDVRLDSGIWWNKELQDALVSTTGGLPVGLIERERDVLRKHPTRNPTTEPLLKFPEFTVEQFIAFENCAHFFRPAFLVPRLTVDWAAADDPSRSYVEAKWAELQSLKQRNPRAVELVEALLGKSLVGRRARGVRQQRVDAIRMEFDRLRQRPEDAPKTGVPAKGGVKRKIRDRLGGTALFEGKRELFDDAWDLLMKEARASAPPSADD